MKKAEITFIIAILFFAGCAGNKAEIKRHRAIAKSAYDASDFRTASAHIDSAAVVCSNIGCVSDAYRWLIQVSTASGNDVLRAQAYKNLALAYLDYASKAKPANSQEFADSAHSTASRYLSWSDSLHALRGDPFPLADALLLSAQTAPADSPGIAIENLLRITVRPESAEVPRNLQPYIAQAEKLLDEFGREMALRYKAANEAFEQTPESAIEDYKYVFNSAAGFRNSELAAESAIKIAEYYRDTGNKTQAAIWAGEALFWESRNE